MNFSVWTARRKWPCAAAACGPLAIVTAFVLVWAAFQPAPAQARQRTLFTNPLEDLFQPPRRRRRALPIAVAVPLPKPRPADAPQRATAESAAPNVAVQPVEPPVPASPEVQATRSVPIPEPRPTEADAPAAPSSQAALPPQAPVPAPEPPSPSACRVALTEEVAIAPSLPDIIGPGSCGGTDLVRLEAVMIPGKGRVPLRPAATLRCEMASAVAGWIREDMAPLAATLGTALAELDNFDSFDCRGRNRVVGAKMSEHGRANALDVRGLKLASGQVVSLTDRAAGRETREAVLRSVCARFSTVLGPGSDGYHEDHIHLDLAARSSGYRICQWVIYEPLPQIAPLMPAVRPDEAPPRDVAEGKTEDKTEGRGAPAAAMPPNAEDEVEPEPAPPPKPAKKRRRLR